MFYIIAFALLLRLSRLNSHLIDDLLKRLEPSLLSEMNAAFLSPFIPGSNANLPKSLPVCRPTLAPMRMSVAPSRRLADFLSRAEEGNPALSLSRAEAAFAALKSRASKPAIPPSIVSPVESAVLSTSTPIPHFDVVVAGGTLGIIYATALQHLGWRVVVIERGPLQGREQEWNISRSELSSLVIAGVLTDDQLEDIINTEWDSPGRIGFALRDQQPRELRVNDVLNVGVSPAKLVRHAAANFADKGGVVLDLHRLEKVQVGTDAVRLELNRQMAPRVSGALGAGGTGVASGGDEGEQVVLTARLLVDAMGTFSPIAEQTRGARKPDGVCITVGSCLRADFDTEMNLDVIYSTKPINAERSTQYFWEAFPVGNDEKCRTTYMFAYGECDEGRPTLTETLEDYIETLSKYQGVDVDEAQVKRVLFGFFPSYYRDSPTRIEFDRVLPVGDAGGLQSPISFGGFGCCLRHLLRISRGVDEALRMDDDSLLMKRSLQMLQWYLPSLSVTGLFHRAMSVRPGESTAGPLLDEYGINELLWSNMVAMQSLGRNVQLPFLRDVVTARGLSLTLSTMVVGNPMLATKLPLALGASELLDWSRHYVALVVYAVALPVVQAVKKRLDEVGTWRGRRKFWLNRAVDAMYYGSGADAEEDL